MTRKHYILLANLIKQLKNEGIGGTDLSLIAYRLAEVLKSDNPNFSPSRFFKACGFTS